MANRTIAPAQNRSRWKYALAALIVIGLGLGSRWDAVGLPPLAAKYAGDSLWGLVVFLGVALVQPRRSTRSVACLAAAFACAVELSQLYHALWLDAVRRTLPGALVLGTPESKFAWADIAAYLIGISAGVAAEYFPRHSSNRH